MVILLGAVAAALLIGSITLWAVSRDELPRLNSDTVTLVKFVASPDYQRLPFQQRTGYMEVLEGRDDNNELEDLFDAGKISEAEYRAAMDEAWLGQQYKRTQKFASLPPAARASYVRDLVDKKLEKDARKDAKKAAGKTKKDEPSDAVKRDESGEETLVAAQWPADLRAKWDQFRQAYRTERAARAKSNG